MLTYIFFILGFIFLIKGADILVEGSSSLAKRIGISDMVIGLTIVAFGTSAPELIVNIIASIKGNTDICIGNILGSNIANILLILGISALIYPLKVQKATTWKEIPLNFLATLALLLMVNDVFIDKANVSILSRSDGLILIIFFILFLDYTVGLAKATKENHNNYKKYPVYKAVGMTLGGIVALTYGGKWVVSGAVQLAQAIGMSEAMIGLTIVAVGTSLPELATSAVAAYKHKTDIAIGNIVGSNLFNIFWILGISSIIRPLPFNTMINTDIMVLLVATLALFISCFVGKRYQLYRLEGGFFIFAYIAYVVYLIIRG